MYARAKALARRRSQDKDICSICTCAFLRAAIRPRLQQRGVLGMCTLTKIAQGNIVGIRDGRDWLFELV